MGSMLGAPAPRSPVSAVSSALPSAPRSPISPAGEMEAMGRRSPYDETLVRVLVRMVRRGGALRQLRPGDVDQGPPPRSAWRPNVLSTVLARAADRSGPGALPRLVEVGI